MDGSDVRVLKAASKTQHRPCAFESNYTGPRPTDPPTVFGPQFILGKRWCSPQTHAPNQPNSHRRIRDGVGATGLRPRAPAESAESL